MKNFLHFSLPVEIIAVLTFLKGAEQFMMIFSCISLLVMIFAILTASKETEQIMITSKNFTRELTRYQQKGAE